MDILILTQIYHSVCSLDMILFLFSDLFSFMCCTQFLEIFILYVTMSQTKYLLSPKDLKSKAWALQFKTNTKGIEVIKAM